LREVDTIQIIGDIKINVDKKADAWRPYGMRYFLTNFEKVNAIT
tara:strand:+ start:1705 stop:1836 length:132 start_codon:yes stop_codon:yes gene_type:complete